MPIHSNFLTMVSISLFYFCEKVYEWKSMDDWGKFNETSLPEKEDLYSHLNMEDITDIDYAQVKRICKGFKIKNLGEYHDLYVFFFYNTIYTRHENQ